MAARSELNHRLLELKTSMTGRLAPKILSRKTSGVDGLAKKLIAKTPPAAPDESLAAELEHPDDVPEIVTGNATFRDKTKPNRPTRSQR